MGVCSFNWILFSNILFYDGIFPKIWKHAIVPPLYKGKGSRSEPGSYRPISLCSCLGKVLERVVHKQLVQFLSDRKLLSQAQHGFIAGRSTVTNMLTFDKYIGGYLMSKHPYNVISLDFQKKAFDKAPHAPLLYQCHLSIGDMR